MRVLEINLLCEEVYGVVTLRGRQSSPAAAALIGELGAKALVT